MTLLEIHVLCQGEWCGLCSLAWTRGVIFGVPEPHIRKALSHLVGSPHWRPVDRRLVSESCCHIASLHTFHSRSFAVMGCGPIALRGGPGISHGLALPQQTFPKPFARTVPRVTGGDPPSPAVGETVTQKGTSEFFHTCEEVYPCGKRSVCRHIVQVHGAGVATFSSAGLRLDSRSK